jgi:molybdopterin molybdotransferase
MADDALPFPSSISVSEAQARIVDIASKCTLSQESVTLEDAFGRILAGDIHAPADVPGFVNSAMDGFAVRAADLPVTGSTSLRLSGEIFAGGSSPATVTAGTCVRITTGAPLPPGADTVVMKENTRVQEGTVEIQAGTAAGAHVRAAGEDYRSGDLALRRGMRLTPAGVSVLASFGMTEIDVVAKPRAVLLTTGDELHAPGTPLGFGGIYDSNRYSLGGLLEQHGAALLRHERVPDVPEQLRTALLRAGDEADVILSSGGVSAGEADFLPRLIREIGEVYFWKVRIKPGMPFLFGRIGKALVFALPGNPVSGIATFLTLVKPALDAMSRVRAAPSALRARLKQPVHKRHTRAEFQRASLECDANGNLWVTPHAKQGSGMLRGVAEADALVLLPEDAHEFAIGTVVDLLPLPGWPR